MGVSTSTCVSFYNSNKQLINKYFLEDRSGDYIYQGLVCGGGAEFNSENFGEFAEEEKEIMKVYFDEESMSVIEDCAEVTKNIQSPNRLLPIWIKIRSSIILPFQKDLKNYHTQIIADYKIIKEEFESYNTSRKISIPQLTELKSEHNFENLLWEIIWKIDSVSKVIALLIVAQQNQMLVEITAVDG